MRRADIEVPTIPSIWTLGKISLLSPGYLLSVERHPSTWWCRITSSTSSLLDVSVSQSSSLVHLHSSPVANQAEGTFERLRYILGGNRPS